MLDADIDRGDKSPLAGAKPRPALSHHLRVYGRDIPIGQGRTEAASDHIARYRIAPTPIAKRLVNTDLYEVSLPTSGYKSIVGVLLPHRTNPVFERKLMLNYLLPQVIPATGALGHEHRTEDSHRR
jgi:hypothetical protein